MTRRRRNSVLDAIEAFNAAYDTTTKVGKEIELSRVAAEKPVETGRIENTQTADPDYYGSDGTAAGPATGEVTITNPKYTFQGQTYDKPLTNDEIRSARQVAQAGILEKYGDLEGADRIRQREQQSKLTNMQIKSAERQAKREDLEDAYTAGKGELFKNSNYARVQSANSEYQNAVADYQKRLSEAGTDPAKLAAVGMPPVKPSEQYGVVESLQDMAAGIAYDVKHGKGSMEKMTQFAEKMKAVQDEGYITALQVAQAGGDKAAIVKAFNGSGKLQITEDQIADIKKTTVDLGGGSKVPTTQIVLKDGRVIDTARQLDSFGKANQLVERAFKGDELKLRREQVGNEAARVDIARDEATRAKTKDDRAETEKTAKADAAVALYQKNNPGASKAELDAVRTGVLQAVPKEAKNEYSATTDSMGINVTRTNKDTGQIDIIDPKSGKVKTIPAPGTKPAAAAAPAKGTVVKGDDGDYEFIGGDPNDRKNWRKK